MADSLPITPTDGESYNRGIEDYRKQQEQRRLSPPGRRSNMQSRRSSSPRRSSPRRSRSHSPVRRRSRSRSPRRDSYRGGSGRGSRGAGRSVRNKECRVYVSNLNYDTKWMELKDVMKRIAPVEHVEVFTDGDGRSKGCAVVEYETSSDASSAIKVLDGYELQGRKLRMREDNVDDMVYKEQLKTQKDKTKALKESSHMMDHQLPFGGGGAFGGGLGIAGLGGAGGSLGGLSAILGAQTAQVQLLTMLNSRGGDPVNSSVFVSNLDYDVNWQKLKDMFRRAGNATRCDIAQDDSKRSKGFGSVQFETPMEALSAIALFNGFEIGGRTMIVRLDRNASLHQALGQLGINSKDINQQTLVQIQSLATIAALGGGLGGLGGLGQLGGISQLSNLSQIGGLGALSGLGGLNSTMAYNGLQTSQQSTAQSGLNLSNLSSLGSLGGLGGMLGNNSLNSSALSGLGSVNTASGGGSGFAGLSTSNSYGGNSLSSGGFGSSQTDRRSSDGGASRSYSSSNAGCPRVFVRNLPFSLKWQDLKDRFREAGKVVRADVKTNDDGRSKGYAVVTFETSSDANRAVSLFNGSKIDGREIEVRIDRTN